MSLKLTPEIISEKFTKLNEENTNLITDIIKISAALQAEIDRITNSGKTPPRDLTNQRHGDITTSYRYHHHTMQYNNIAWYSDQLVFKQTTETPDLLSKTNATNRLSIEQKQNNIHISIYTLFKKIRHLWFNSKNKITHRNKSPRHSEITEYLQEFKAHLLKVAANHNIEISE